MDPIPFQIIWLTAAASVFVGWLVVSFSPPGRRRTIVEWCSAIAMYVGLLSFFVYLALGARAEGNKLVLFAFGALCVLFSGGLLVSLWQTIRALAKPRSQQGNPTH